MSFFQALRRFFIWLRDTLVKIVGAPLSALWRGLKALLKRIRALIDAVVDAWVRIFTKQPDDERLVSKGGEAALPLFAAAVMITVMYGFVDPFFNLPRFRFCLLAAGVWLVALVVGLRSVRYYPRSPLRRFLVEAEKRTGLVWMERVGLLVGLWATWWTLSRDPGMTPMAVAVAIGFFGTFFREYEERPLLRWRDPITITPPDVTPDDRHVVREFHWDLTNAGRTDETDLTVIVSLDVLERLKAANVMTKHDPNGMPCMDEWVLDSLGSEVDQAVIHLDELSRERRYSSFLEISNALAFAQSVEYVSDLESTGHDDYWKYAIETIYDQVGDCDDSAILAAAVLHRMGYQVALLFPPSHAAVGVAVPEAVSGHFIEHAGVRYFYCETTADGWSVGELPERYDEVGPIPVLPVRGRS